MSTNSSEDKSHDNKKITRRDFLKLSGAIAAMTGLSFFILLGKLFGATNKDANNITQTSNANT